MKNPIQTLYPLLALATLSVLLAGCSNSGGTAQVPPTPAPASESSSSSVSAVVTGKKYADGTYSATGNYTSPGGAETVDVSLTLSNGLITDATFTGNATKPRSQQFQEKFAAGFKEQVIGKPLDGLSLAIINGSSLTPIGFNDAVGKIQVEAQG